MVLLVATETCGRGPAKASCQKKQRISIESQSNVENVQREIEKEAKEVGDEKGRERCLHNIQVNSLSITISGRASLLLELSQMEEVEKQKRRKRSIRMFIRFAAFAY